MTTTDSGSTSGAAKRPPLMDFDEALSRLAAAAHPVRETEQIQTLAALDRVLAAEVRSQLTVPPQDNSSMDGYAVRCADIQPGRNLPVTQRIAAGFTGQPLEPGSVARIFTGAPIPEGADAVVMQEMARAGPDHVSFEEAPEPGAWIRRAGEDIRAGEIALARGTLLSPQACGMAASVGAAELKVYRRLRVACFFTGDELVMPGNSLAPGQIYNSNRFLLSAMIARMGCELIDLGIVKDTLDDTREALRRAARNADLVLSSGGMSVGEEDHVRPAVEAEGALDLWQIAMKPGKPLAYGHVRRPAGEASTTRDPSLGDRAHFIGLPGNPVSVFVTFLMMVRPFIRRLQGLEDVQPLRLKAIAGFDIARPDKRREFLRVRLDHASGRLMKFDNQSSGVLTSTVWGDGLVDNRAGATIKAGDEVEYLPFAALLNP